MEGKLRIAHDWFAQKADTVHAQVWLVVLSFTEASIFLIPPDPLLAAMVFVHKERWVRYAMITAAASVAGAVFGYVVGAVLFETIGVRLIDFYNLHEYMASANALVDKNVFVFTLTAAFTPIPFKAAVMAAGFTKANFAAFFVAAVVGRGARYTFVALIAKVFGDNSEYIMKRFWLVTTVAGIVVLSIFTALHFLIK